MLSPGALVQQSRGNEAVAGGLTVCYRAECGAGQRQMCAVGVQAKRELEEHHGVGEDGQLSRIAELEVKVAMMRSCVFQWHHMHNLSREPLH
eukprot:660828-Amphidinium_carterae.1